MIAFDTNVLTEILAGNDSLIARATAIPVNQQAVPVIVIEEIIRGRLNVITRYAHCRHVRHAQYKVDYAQSPGL